MDRAFDTEKLLFPIAIAFGLFVLWAMGADFGPLLDIAKGLPGIDHWFAETNQGLGVDTHAGVSGLYDRAVEFCHDAQDWNEGNVLKLYESTK